MLKLFENNFINTMNKLAVSIEDIKLGRFGGEDKGRDGGGGGGGGGGMTYDVMSVLTEQHNSLLLVLKLLENRFINTMNELAVSIEDIKLGRFAGEDKGRDGGGGGGGDGERL
jgi:hypothetical protein